jgi:hypothetical protein
MMTAATTLGMSTVALYRRCPSVSIGYVQMATGHYRKLSVVQLQSWTQTVYKWRVNAALCAFLITQKLVMFCPAE